MFSRIGAILVQRGRWSGRLLLLFLGMLIVVGLWWKLPPWPRSRLHASVPIDERGIVLSGNGQFLAVPQRRDWSEDGETIDLWDMTSGRHLARHSIDSISTHGHRAWLSFDGMVLAYRQGYEDRDNRLVIADWPNNRNMEMLLLPANEFKVALSERMERLTPDGRTLITSGPYGLRVWDVATGRERESALPSGIYLEDNDRERKRALQENEDGTYTLWCLETLSKKGTFTAPKEPRPLVSADGSRVLVARVNEIAIIDADTGRDLCTIPAEGAAIFPFLFSPDGTRLITNDQVDEDNQVSGKRIVWDVSDMPPRRLGELAADSHVYHFSPDGKWMVGKIIGLAGPFRVVLWETSTLKSRELAKDIWTGAWFNPYARKEFSADSRVLAVLCTPQHRSGHASVVTDWIQKLIGSPTGPNPDDVLLLWDLPNNRPMATLGDCQSFVLSQDSRTIAVVHADGGIDIHDLPIKWSAWVEFGLPALLVLLAGLLLRQFRRSAGAHGLHPPGPVEIISPEVHPTGG